MQTPPVNTTSKKFHLGMYAIIEKGKSILLVRKSRGPYQGSWDLPGGRPSYGETIFQTLEREVKEETGIQLIDIAPYSNQAFTVEYESSEGVISLHHTCLIYKALKFDASQFQDTINGEDVAGCAWLEKSQLSHLPLSRVVLSIL